MPDSAALTRFRAVFSGTVLLPSHPGFDVFLTANAPSLVVRPLSVDDVVIAIQYASTENLALSIRSGGHSGGFWTNTAGGIVLDMSGFASVSVEGQLVTVGPGATWGAVADALHSHGLAISSGDTRSVGVGGLTLGGGVGWMVRQYGLTIDSLVSAQLVTASGAVVTADAVTNPDLFWAIRGGGGNFGVVTAFTFEGHPVSAVVHGAITYAPASLSTLLNGYREVMRTAPEALNVTFAQFPPMGPDAPTVPQLHVLYAGADEVAAMAAIAPLLALDGYVSHDIQPKTYADVLEDPHPPEAGAPMPVLVSNSGFVPQLSPACTESLERLANEVPAAILMVRYLQGAFNRVDADATALAWRDSEAFISSLAFLPPGSGDVEIAGVNERWRQIAPFTRGGYGNFMTYAGERAVSMMYPPTTRVRLGEVKATYDPTNLFNQNQNVEPMVQS